jgi:hypothetical protein
MATQLKFSMRCVKTVSGVAISRYSWYEKASQTFIRGALLYLDTSGRLTECGADPLLIAGVATGPGRNASADFGALQTPVELAHPNNVFRAYVDDGAAEGTGVLTAAAIGKAYGVAKAASGGFWFIDKNDATNDRMVIWDSWDEPGYALTDVRPHVYATFLGSVFQMNVGT